MTWARLDDRFWSNRKIRKAWKQSRASVGLHVMAITYCAMHETDGVIDGEFLEALIPNTKERQSTLDALLDVGLWHAGTDGYFCIHDYLEYNPSSAQVTERRQRDSERKAQARGRGVRSDSGDVSEWNPNGVRVDSTRSPRGIQEES